MQTLKLPFMALMVLLTTSHAHANVPSLICMTGREYGDLMIPVWSESDNVYVEIQENTKPGRAEFAQSKVTDLSIVGVNWQPREGEIFTLTAPGFELIVDPSKPIIMKSDNGFKNWSKGTVKANLPIKTQTLLPDTLNRLREGVAVSCAFVFK